MTYQIPIELETAIRAAVQGGRFGSVDEAMTEAARLLIREHHIEPAANQATSADPEQDPILGLFCGDADLMDSIVTQAYRDRDNETWREIGVE